MNKVAKILFFCCVCYVTSLITTSILAQQRKTVAPDVQRSDLAIGAATSTASERSTASAIQRTPIALGTMQSLAETHLRSQEILVKDGIASVKAHVSIADKRPGMTYFWRIGAVGPGGDLLAGSIYDHQIFSVDRNGQKEVDFADVVELPKGSRRIELVLYEKHVDRDFSFLNEPAKARGAEVIRVVKLLTP